MAHQQAAQARREAERLQMDTDAQVRPFSASRSLGSRILIEIPVTVYTHTLRLPYV